MSSFALKYARYGSSCKAVLYRTVRFANAIPMQSNSNCACRMYVHGSVRLTSYTSLPFRCIRLYLRCIITYMLCELWGDIALTSSGSAVAPCGPYRSHCRDTSRPQEKGRAPAAQLPERRVGRRHRRRWRRHRWQSRAAALQRKPRATTERSLRAGSDRAASAAPLQSAPEIPLSLVRRCLFGGETYRRCNCSVVV